MAPRTWAEAQDMLARLCPDEAQRGVIRYRLLLLEVEKRLEYFEDTEASVRSTLLSLADSGGFSSDPLHQAHTT